MNLNYTKEFFQKVSQAQKTNNNDIIKIVKAYFLYMRSFNPFNRLGANKKLYLISFLLGAFAVLSIFGVYFYLSQTKHESSIVNGQLSMVNSLSTPTPTPFPLPPLPSSKVLSNGGYHIFQTFNN